MPYLMDNSKFQGTIHMWWQCSSANQIQVDPETKAEFEEMSSKSPLTGANGPANQLQNFDLASWMAGKPAEAPSGGGGKKK
jgi:hypothetical protein